MAVLYSSPKQAPLERYVGPLRTDPDVDAVQGPPPAVVDRHLQPAAAAALSAINLGRVKEVGARIVGIFLQNADTQEVKTVETSLVADMLMECLPAFVHELGGQVVECLDTSDGECAAPTLSEIVVGGRPLTILVEGSLFIITPEQRIVISVKPFGEQRGIFTRSWVRTITIGSPAAFMLKWRQYAQRCTFYKNRALFANGTLLPEDRTYSWDDISIESGTKEVIRTHVEVFLKNRLKLQALGVKGRRGIILSGPPGTGKTLIGKILASQRFATFIWLPPQDILQMIKLDPLLEAARFLAPTILFFEDLDLVSQERTFETASPLGDLMNQLDGAMANDGVIAMATTNRLETVEQALRNRPGRFDRIVEIAGMSAECRSRYLARLLARVQVQPADLSYLVQRTDGCTGALVEELATTLCMLALEARPHDTTVTLNRDEIDSALAEILPRKERTMGFRPL